jgi:hypothetical protein
LKTELLEQVLSALSDREEFDYTFSRLELNNIEVETEVTTSNGRRPDAVIWVDGEWFFCFELKIGASERSAQTPDYVEADAFDSIGVEKSEMLPDGDHYVYLAPADSSPPEADEFTPVSWEWIRSQLQAFVETSYGGYPARTTAQLQDFIDTIERELHMTQYQENQQEKAKLYFEHYEEISEAKNAFEAQWETFADNWATQLVEHMEVGKLAEFSALRDSDVALDVPVTGEDDERWVFQQGNSDWAGLYKSAWWRRKDDFSRIYAQIDNDGVRITFYHRLEKNREQAIKDSTLELTLTHGTGNGKEFKSTFRDNLTTNIKASDAPISSAVSVGGRRTTPLTASYNIPTEEYNDFFDAYIAALTDAFHDLVIDNREVIEAIDEAFEESLSVFE